MMTTVDIVVEPGGAQNLLVPDLAIGSPSAASRSSARLAHTGAYIYDMSICDVASPVSLCIHGQTLVARQEATTTITIDPEILSTAASRTFQTSTASSTATSSPAVSSILGPLLGGLLGGFFGLLLIVIAIWYAWTSRHRLFRQDDTLESQTVPTTPNIEHKLPDRFHRQSTLSSPAPTPQPYQYGVVGRPGSRLSTSLSTSTSSPHSPNPSRSRSRSPGLSVLTYSRPPSTVMNIMMPPSPTPGAPAGINTPISPGPSLAPSSRPPTPGVVGYPSPLQQYHSEWQQQRARVSWPQMSQSEDGHAADPRRSPVLRPLSERRPSRLSLTLTNWNPETDGILGELVGGKRLASQNGEALAESTTCSIAAVANSREGGGEGEAGAEVSQETLTPANAGPTDSSRAGS
ncbi:hypothetical protein DAEQUDRAFT_248011 [Daedalea quercina L-15889]|uniref:Transmembrane protein n=1 Tax=Daedalea quercina L-15889 TaxID=1314783 RepID=A0A165QMA4_9APHY|nr:hypothetical protein DAEQUDRAFT_248011 [Daedalea quercina L-15889]